MYANRCKNLLAYTWLTIAVEIATILQSQQLFQKKKVFLESEKKYFISLCFRANKTRMVEASERQDDIMFSQFRAGLAQMGAVDCSTPAPLLEQKIDNKSSLCYQNRMIGSIVTLMVWIIGRNFETLKLFQVDRFLLHINIHLLGIMTNILVIILICILLYSNIVPKIMFVWNTQNTCNNCASLLIT